MYTDYQKKLLKNQSLDFDDLIMTTIKLFERVPEVLEFYQRKFQYIHVDEYQDTNRAQYLLVKLHKQVLRPVRILILVYVNVLEFTLIKLKHFRHTLEKLNRRHD